MTETVVSLALNDEERVLIQELLEDRYRTLLLEIAHTDHYHFKGVLRKKVELVESMMNRFLVHA